MNAAMSQERGEVIGYVVIDGDDLMLGTPMFEADDRESAEACLQGDAFIAEVRHDSPASAAAAREEVVQVDGEPIDDRYDLVAKYVERLLTLLDRARDQPHRRGGPMGDALHEILSDMLDENDEAGNPGWSDEG